MNNKTKYCKYSGNDCDITFCINVDCNVAKELDRIKSQKKGMENKLEVVSSQIHLGGTPCPSDTYNCSNINFCSNSSDKCQIESYRDSCPVKSDFNWGKHGVGF